ncbi:MAG: PQQ-dependent sugar dehydrogenase [Acidobacteriota bacterium]
MKLRPSWVAVLLVASACQAQFATTEVSAPGATPFLLDTQQWSWEDLSPTVPDVLYNVLRLRPGDEGFRCVASNLSTSSWEGDPELPPPGEAWWYLVNADDGWQENRHGSTLDVSERCACSGTLPEPAPDLIAEVVGDFSEPVHLTAPRHDRMRAYVVERGGVIEVLDLRDDTSQVFLDISAQVRVRGEMGLLSLAFHPEFETNGRFFVYYNAPGGAFGEGVARVAEFVASDPDTADPLSERLIYESDRPTPVHVGGQVAFGPRDGYLYVSLGDGDIPDAAQLLDSEHGKILRLDVDSGEPYAIPPDNPFVDVPGALGEIWSYGLRNPWRFTFDRETGDLWLGDVGDGCSEEVSRGLATAGGGENFGWPMMEGIYCAAAEDCLTTCGGCPTVTECAELTGPVVDFSRMEVPGTCSVIGGHVYRGCRMPEMTGRYFYADWCAGDIWSFRLDGDELVDLREWDFPEIWGPVSFGEDARGEIYVMTAEYVLRLSPG